MLLIKEVTTNLSYPATPAVVVALQGDSCRALAIRFLQGEESWEIPADAQVFVQYTCADGSSGIFDTLPDGSLAYTVEGDTLTVRFPMAMCAVPGCTKAQVTVFSDGEQVSTFPVELRILPQANMQLAGGEYVNLHRWLFAQTENLAFVKAVVAALPDGDEVSY